MISCTVLPFVFSFCDVSISALLEYLEEDFSYFLYNFHNASKVCNLRKGASTRILRNRLSTSKRTAVKVHPLAGC